MKDEPVFEPEATHAMSVAFEDICRSLKVDGNQTARETIAIRIMNSRAEASVTLLSYGTVF